MVLNSLSLDFISASVALLGEGGCFEEIGKRGVWSEMRMGTVGMAEYDAVALDSMMAANPTWMQGVLGQLSGRIGRAGVHGLPLHSFDMARQWEAAFRLLQSGGNVGKAVLRITAADGAAAAGGQLAVSYTHLTLPTILLV